MHASALLVHYTDKQNPYQGYKYIIYVYLRHDVCLLQTNHNNKHSFLSANLDTARFRDSTRSRDSICFIFKRARLDHRELFNEPDRWETHPSRRISKIWNV